MMLKLRIENLPRFIKNYQDKYCIRNKGFISVNANRERDLKYWEVEIKIRKAKLEECFVFAYERGIDLQLFQTRDLCDLGFNVNDSQNPTKSK